MNTRERVRFFFIVAMWDKLYTLKENNLLLLKFVNLINYMGIYKNILCDWFDDMGGDNLKLIIDHLNLIL